MIWVAGPGTDTEFIRPVGWQKLTASRNVDWLDSFSPGKAICLNTGGTIAVVDVDPRNGGDIEKVQHLLAKLGVRLFAAVRP